MRAFLIFASQYPQLIVVPVILCFGAWQYVSRYEGANRRRVDWLMAAATLVIPAEMLAQSVAEWMSVLRPLKYDLYVAWLEGEAATRISFAIGRAAEDHFWLKALLSASYGCCSVAVLAVFVAYLWLRSEGETLLVVKTFALNLFAALPIYLAVPVCGPRFAFHNFPAEFEMVRPHAVAISSAPNGFPSVHFSTALVALYFAWRWPVGRVIGIVFVILTGLATLGSGEHYLLDLVVAVPYALMVIRLARGWRREPARDTLVPDAAQEYPATAE